MRPVRQMLGKEDRFHKYTRLYKWGNGMVYILVLKLKRTNIRTHKGKSREMRKVSNSPLRF